MLQVPVKVAKKVFEAVQPFASKYGYKGVVADLKAKMLPRLSPH